MLHYDTMSVDYKVFTADRKQCLSITELPILVQDAGVAPSPFVVHPFITNVNGTSFVGSILSIRFDYHHFPWHFPRGRPGTLPEQIRNISAASTNVRRA